MASIRSKPLLMPVRVNGAEPMRLPDFVPLMNGTDKSEYFSNSGRIWTDANVIGQRSFKSVTMSFPIVSEVSSEFGILNW